MKLATLTNAYSQFLFKPQPVQSVVIFRFLLGSLLLLNWYMTWQHLDIFWSPQGLVSLATSQSYWAGPRFSFFDFLPDIPQVGRWIAILNLLGIIGLLLGFWTRTSIAIAFFTLISFHFRNTFILNSADVIMRNFLFFLFFTPCADMWSLDRWRALKKGTAPLVPLEKAPWALRLLQIQFCLIYISTVLFKIQGKAWIDGTAVYYATRLDEFLRFQFSLLDNIAVVKFATWSTLVIEFALGTLVWIREFRYWVLLAGVGLHIGIDLTMNIPIFEWLMIAGMIVMIPSKDFDYLMQTIRDGNVRMYVSRTLRFPLLSRRALK